MSMTPPFQCAQHSSRLSSDVLKKSATFLSSSLWLGGSTLRAFKRLLVHRRTTGPPDGLHLGVMPRPCILGKTFYPQMPAAGDVMDVSCVTFDPRQLAAAPRINRLQSFHPNQSAEPTQGVRFHSMRHVLSLCEMCLCFPAKFHTSVHRLEHFWPERQLGPRAWRPHFLTLFEHF